MKTWLIIILGLQLAVLAADNTPIDPAREREMRDRYEKVLLRNPFQDRAFNSVYESYAKIEGVDKWVEALKPQSESGEDAQAALLLLGQIYDRQFKTAEAIAALEQAASKGEERPQFKVLLGTLYYKVGKDDKAAGLLSSGLDTLTDLDQRSAVCRMLGNLYLRQGKRDDAIKVWQRIAEQNPDEMFAQIELAEIFSDNRMWDQAIAVYRQIAERSRDDPYRRCRALRSIGQCQVQAEKFKEALATYEQALELVSPGNWLFEDLKLRLVGVYEDIGDLAGLVKYAQARLDQNPGDLEFRDLLAETYTRMTKFADAEKEYRAILERNPRSSSVYEKLISLYLRTGQKVELAAAFEKLIELFPTDTDYLRRLGEFHVRDGNPAKAKETWRRIVATNPSGDRFATLASWLESYEFPEDAIAAYQQALEKSKNRDWTERLASLKHQKGEEAEAVKLWLSMIDPATSKAEDYAAVASILEANSKIDEALKLRKTAADKDPKNLEARLAYAKVLMKKQQFEPAIAEFELLAAQSDNEFLMQQGESGRLDAWRELGILEDKQKELERDLNANPTDAKKLGQLARLYERAGQREKAIALYETRREKEPGNVEHLRSLANLYKNAKQTDLAIATFKALLEHDKNRARVYQKELLDIYLGLDLKAESIAAAEAIVSLAPGDPEARLTLAQVYHLYRQPEKALGEYRYALRLEPNEPDYHRQYGEALSQEKNYGEAQDAFRKMLDTAKEDGTRVAAVSSLARIHLQQDRLDELISEFQRRIRNTPKKLAAYEELAAVYKESGQIVKAVETLESGLQTVDEKTAALRSLIRTTYEAQDFPKTRSYFEQLLAQSGKPSAQEYERLGQIYSQLGELEKAKATWSRIVSDAPKDPKAHDRLASVLRESGFTDEALAMKSKAVELDPNDYKRRFEYAQLLAQNEQPVEALKQLNLLLEIGDREEAKKEAESEKKVERVAKGQQGRSAVSPYQFVYGMRSSGGGYYGGGWQGTFKQYRPQLLMFMANVAQRSIGEDSFVEQLNARVQKAKANIDAKRDLLSVLQMYNRVDEALKLALDILAAAPNDTDLLQQTALYYQAQQKLDKAIPLMEQMAQSHPKQRVQALTALVPLYFQSKQEAKALEAADQLLKENPTDMTVIYSMGSFMQNNGKLDRARAIYQKGLEIDPQTRPNVLYNLASIAQRENKHDDAAQLFTEMLTTDPAGRYAYMAVRRQQNLYVPVTSSSRNYSGNPMGNLPSQVFGYIDYQKGQAITQLKRTRSGATNAFAPLEEIARGYRTAVSAGERNRAWDTAKLLCAYYITEKEYDKAGELLKFMRDAGFDEMEWYNGAIYLAQLKEDYPAMLKLYDQALERFPAKARDVTQAKTAALIMAKNYDQAGKLIRDMNQQRVPPAQVLNLINNLVTAGEKKLAKELLEEHLSGVSRNSDTLAALARLHADENDYEKAITLGNEAWDRKSHGRSTQAYYYGPGYYYSSSSSTSGDSLLRDLHRFYVGAGKSEELIAKFKERLDKQPSSVQAHEYLAQLYRLSSRRDEALAIYKQLSEKRPHLMQTRRQIASLYTEMGDMKKATEFYEALLKTTPTAYQEISWELRYLYQRMGKGKELAQMEDKLAAKARDPHQVRQLADRYRQEGDTEKAIELYRKAIQISPGDSTYIKNQLAGVLVESGRLEEAVKLYEEWLDAPQIRGQGWIDHHTMKQLVGLFRGTGKLQTLKDRCEAELKKNSLDRISKAMQVHIAVIEKRFGDAIAGFKALAQSGQDSNGIYEIMNLADITGDVQSALDIVEKDAQNVYDEQRLARLYFVKGDRKKAQEWLEKYWERYSQYGGSHYRREVLSRYVEFELWDAAEVFVKKNRDTIDESYERQEFDRSVADAYVKFGHYKTLVDEILKKESFKGRDLDLLKAIAREYKGGEEGGKRRQFLEKLVAADPKNRELAAELADVYAANPADADKRLAILKDLVEKDPNSTTRRTSYTAAMIQADRADEALAELEQWAAAKPVDSRYTLLSGQQKAAGRLRQARASLQKAIELADSSKKTDLELQLAEFDEQYGDPGPRRAALKARFEKRKDASSFQACLNYLDSAGLNAEAYALFMTNKDAGYLDRYQGDTAFKVCMNEGDYQTPLELNWQFLRYVESYNRNYYFDRSARLFAERGKFLMLVNDLEARINAETNRNLTMFERLGKAWERAGHPEKALEIYNLLTATNPFNRTALQAKTDLLLKLNQTGEAMDLLRSSRGITTLDAEVTAKQQLAALFFKIKRDAEAEAELNALLAWAQGGSVLEKAGDAWFAAKKYERAAEMYEKAAKASRSYNYSAMLANLGKCYAHMGRIEDAIKIWESRPSARGGGSSSSMQEWLLAERLFEAVVKYIEPKLKGDIGEVRRYVGLTQACIELGDTNKAFEVLQRASREVPSDNQADLRRRTASLLINYDLVPAALAQTAKHDDPKLAAALVEVFGGTSNRTEIASLAPLLKDFKTSDRELQIYTGDALLRQKQPEAAAAWFRQALPSTKHRIRLSAARGLAMAGAREEAEPVLRECLERKPQDIFNNPELLPAAAKAGLRELIAKIISENALHDTHRDYLLTLVDYHSGNTNLNLAPLLAAPNLSASALQELAKIAAPADRIKAFHRLATGGYSATARLAAQSEMARHYAEAGDWKKSVSILAQMFQPGHEAEQARQSIAKVLTRENYEKFRDAILEIVRQDPAQDSASDLLGFCKHVAQRLGQDESAEKLAQTARAAEVETQEAAVWDALLEQWEIAGPFAYESRDTIYPPEHETLSGNNEVGRGVPAEPSRSTSTVLWKKTDPHQMLGIIRVARALGIERAELGNQVSYARAQLRSPEERRVIFCFGSSEWAKVWVNGEEVHSTTDRRSCAPDQDRFVTTLKKGPNTILLKLGGGSFCLRPADGGTGLELARN